MLIGQVKHFFIRKTWKILGEGEKVEHTHRLGLQKAKKVRDVDFTSKSL